jgi:HAE1 family hydrophobic/amphiphilic exporter-1
MAVLVSGFVSLTLTPMLASRFIKPQQEVKHGSLYHWSERIFEKWLGLYERSLQWVLHHRFATLMVALGTLLLAGVLFVVVPKGFLPPEDTGAIFGVTEANPDTSFAAMVERQKEVAAIIGADPDVEAFMSAVGSGGASSSGNSGRVFIHLKPRSERSRSVDEVIASLRPKLAQVTGIRVFLQNPPAIRLGGRLSKSLYQYTLQGQDLQELYHWVPLLEDKLKTLPQLQEVTSDLQITSLQAIVNIDRDRASALGITAQQIDEALSYAYGTRQVSTIYTPSNDYKVILGVADRFQQEPGQIALLHLRAADGQLVPLQALVRISRGTGPLTVTHQGQLPAVTLSFNLAPGAALGEAVDAINEAQVQIGLPVTISGSFQGTAQVFQQSMRGLGLLLLVAIVVIYIVLGVLYESFIHPLTILSGLPSAAVGALLTLLLLGMDLSVTAFVGVIMLVGIVKKNAIMMIDFAINAERNEGKESFDAIVEACRLRFRPIMMTTMAALMGTLPIALGIGAGAESRQPLGVAVVGGLLLSQFLTLYITPVIYLYLERLAGGRRRSLMAEA